VLMSVCLLLTYGKNSFEFSRRHASLSFIWPVACNQCGLLNSQRKPWLPECFAKHTLCIIHWIRSTFSAFFLPLHNQGLNECCLLLWCSVQRHTGTRVTA
jgi:hypothetical protein